MDAAPTVVMYANSWCPYCAAARALLGEKRAPVTEFDIEQHPERRDEMIARTGRRTVPQIFIGSAHVGGYDDLAALDRAGRLDPLLRAPH